MKLEEDNKLHVVNTVACTQNTVRAIASVTVTAAVPTPRLFCNLA